MQMIDHSSVFAFDGGAFPTTYWDSISGLVDADDSIRSESNPFGTASSGTPSTMPDMASASPSTSEHMDIPSSSSATSLSGGSPTPWEVDGSKSRKKQRSSSHRARPFPCTHPNCERSFTSNYTLETHMLSHKPKNKQPYQCTIGCGALFSRKHDRQRHEVSQHGKPTKWVCSHCSNFFSSEKTLSSHTYNCRRNRRSKNFVDGPETDELI
ncbi:hypothetical protein VNI00_011937 [Paramarasmius palmivorus]|uniref:C2H2-type domain-containing protein n=1 Tax=Paramarasmius palmivorus TaxID=297713 RepID=A0AAW0C9Z7_9AGAR